ncbi:MAG: hypothetical protein IJP44_15320 [Bacteroidales bacterium]|nr:hypothetical protein [Bacteroidales bacterium]
MKKLLFFALVLAAVCVMPSCGKEEQAKTITFGDTKGMSVVSYDSLIDNRCIYLDIDNDGVKDFSLDNSYDGLTDSDPQTVCLITLNTNFAFQGKIVEKATYLHCEYNYVEELDKVNAYADCTYSNCDKISDNDEVAQRNELLVNPHETNEFMGIDDDFAGSQLFLFRKDYSFQDPNLYEDGDTTYIYTTSYIYHCDNFPIDSSFYIGFRSSEKQNLLGWIKLILHPINEGKNVSLELIETAIQE